MSRNGGFAEYLVAPEKCLVPIPDNITFEQAAVATDSVTTAVHALMERLDVQEGDPVLILGVKWSADFAGQPIATQTALSCLAPEGVQAQPGYSVVKPTFEINSFALVSNEIEIRGSRGPTVWSCRKSIELVSSGAVNPQIDP